MNLRADSAQHELDDDRMPMTLGERVTWAYGALVVATTIAYFAIVLPQVAATPVGEIAWQVPMLIGIVVVIGGTILGTIASAIVAAIVTRDVEPASDVRDKEIGRYGERANVAVTGAGIAIVLVLAMVGAHQFWIGSVLFAVGAVGATWSNITKIRAYRGSFRG